MPATSVRPSAKRCETCGEPLTHKIAGYFGRGVRKDRALYFCSAHATSYVELHPFNPPPVKMRRR